MNPDINKVFLLHATASNWHWQPCSPRSHPIYSPFWFSLWSSASRLHHLYMMPCDCPISCLYEGAVEAFTIESSWWVYTVNGRALPVWEYCCSSTTETLTSSFIVFGDLSRHFSAFLVKQWESLRLSSVHLYFQDLETIMRYDQMSRQVWPRLHEFETRRVDRKEREVLHCSSWSEWPAEVQEFTGSLHDYTWRFTVYL